MITALEAHRKTDKRREEKQYIQRDLERAQREISVAVANGNTGVVIDNMGYHNWETLEESLRELGYSVSTDWYRTKVWW